jgi:branched-chain amino acid transport system ATP-binding protein
MSSSGGALLGVSGLTKRFGGLVAVKDMALQVSAGEILGLIGPNGSGKSTVMKLIMGIERPDKGSVRINGTEVAGWPAHKIARMGAGIVFQHSRPWRRSFLNSSQKRWSDYAGLRALPFCSANRT